MYLIFASNTKAEQRALEHLLKFVYLFQSVGVHWQIRSSEQYILKSRQYQLMKKVKGPRKKEGRDTWFLFYFA
jgi:hypothetical protein